MYTFTVYGNSREMQQDQAGNIRCKTVYGREWGPWLKRKGAWSLEAGGESVDLAGEEGGSGTADETKDLEQGS